MLEVHIGQDATTAFFGGMYDHSNAAHNVRPMIFCFILLHNKGTNVFDCAQLLATMRVGALHGGLELVGEHAVPPCRELRIVSSD